MGYILSAKKKRCTVVGTYQGGWLPISVSCKRIEIDLDAVGSERLELPEGTVMDIQHVMRAKCSTVYAYEVGVQSL